MILALINTTLYLTKSQVRLLANLIIDVVTRYLAIFIFSLLLWHWSVRAKAIFPPKSVIGFRVFIVLHTAIEVILFVFSLARDGLDVAGGFLENRLVFMGVIAPIAAFSGSIVFGGFGIWFFICTYRVRRHSEARWRFIQLSIFSLIASLTFILESATFFIGGFGIVGLNNASPVELNYINTTRDLITCVRSIVSLGVWGVGWPHRGDNFNSSSSPNPQSNKDKDNSNNNNNNSNNIYSNRPNNSSQDRRWSTFGWVRLASALGHHRSSNNGSNSYASSRPKADPRRMNLLEIILIVKTRPLTSLPWEKPLISSQ
ncbi:hypothetical protein BDF19DRAFT_121938 [Syncephalis fuscata]|nr:hypothetical protein BDF19DRAFT_121938 [Syncephalis fuscata]